MIVRAVLAMLFTAALVVPALAAADRYPATTLVGDVPAQVDADATLAGMQIFLPGGLERQTSVQNGFAALLGEVVAQTPMQNDGSEVPLRDAIAALGANLTVTVEPEDVRYYIEGRPAAVVGALGLLGTALASPGFSTKTLAAAKRALRLRIIESDQSPFGVVSTMLRSSYYRGTGAGYAPTGSPEIVIGASPKALKDFWAGNYLQGGASLAAAGRVDEGMVRAARAAIAKLPQGTPQQLALQVRKPSDPPTRIITHRDIGLPWIGIGFAAPAIGTKDFAPMLVVQSIIDSLGRTDAIVSRPVALRPINAVYQYDVRPANFIIYSSGSSLGSTTGLREIFAATDLLSSKPLDAAVIARYRTLATAQFVMQNITLEDRSALVGTFTRFGLDGNAANGVLSDIAAVTPADVERVVKAYLAKYTVAIILPRANKAALPKPQH
ncbi:MAG: M16 family metallopeptidase [Vulcanimicrobiaceae bacterium]